MDCLCAAEIILMEKEMNDLIKNDSYICIQGWMISELGLKGTDLLIYALIYGFSQDGASSFSGSLAYLMHWTNSSKNTVLKSLRSVQEQGMLIKSEDYIGGVRVCRYTAVRNVDNVDNSRFIVDNSKNQQPATGSKTAPVVQKLHRGGSETAPGVVQKLHRGGSETEPNNIDNNLVNNLADKDNTGSVLQTAAETTAGDRPSETPSAYRKEFEAIWAQYPEGRKQGRKEAQAAYIRARRNGTSYQQISDGIDAYKRQIAVERTPTQYIKQGGTWFNGEGWRDEYNTAAKPDDRRAGMQRALAYRQHSYSADQMRAMGIDLGLDVYDAD